MKQLLVYIMILLIVGVVLAADPPRIDDYKVKVEAAIFDSCTAVADMYPDRPTTLNLRATYYDGTKVLTELINLYGNTSIGDYNVSMCLSQAAEINAERYIDTFPNEAGYTRFPHGLYYDYITTGDTESLNGFDAIRDGTNWDQVNIGANQQIIYSREVAYSIQMYTRAYVLGRPHANQDELINHFVDMALSHLEQWHTGDFLGDFERNDYRQSFMAGLTMNALIEYYEYYDGYSYDYRYYDESHILFGPSFLVGGDWTWGSKVGYGFNAGLGISYNINAEYFSAITLALDLGFIIRF